MRGFARFDLMCLALRKIYPSKRNSDRNSKTASDLRIRIRFKSSVPQKQLKSRTSLGKESFIAYFMVLKSER